MKFDRITITAMVGFYLAGGGAFVQGLLHWRDASYWGQLQHLMLWLILMAVALTCGVFFMISVWPYAWPTYRRWIGRSLGLRNDP
jgi:hypothetical protein